MPNKPVKEDVDLVSFTVLNSMAEERMNGDKTELMTFLRKALKNFVFKLTIIVSKEEGEALVYTAQDRYKKLEEINPKINNLKQAFDLEVEY